MLAHDPLSSLAYPVHSGSWQLAYKTLVARQRPTKFNGIPMTLCMHDTDTTSIAVHTTAVLQLFCWPMTPLIISLPYMITHTPLLAGNLPIKTLVASDGQQV